MAYYCPFQKPRQVIVVALLTSIFWFVLNTVILVSYHGNIALNDAEASKLYGGKNKKYANSEFDRKLPDNKEHELLPRGISKVVDSRAEFDTDNRRNIIEDPVQFTASKTDAHGPENRLIGSKRRNSIDQQRSIKRPRQEIRRKKPRLLRNKQISHKQTITTNVSDLSARFGYQNSNIAEIITSNPKSIKTLDPYGPGERGLAVLVPANEKKKEKDGYDKYAFNEYVSNKISLERSVPDTRSPGCDQKLYPADLPTTSVVICFHNEAWSTLLRTVHTVLIRSPPAVLQEIILIDDFSTFDHLKKPLDDYLAKLDKVRVIRTKKREGLIRARLLGANASQGKVVTFLDAHCEVNVNWLQPLLERIQYDRTIVAVPVIDIISSTDFAYSGTPANIVGGFTWDMQFSWHSLPLSRRSQSQDLTEPIRTPTMAGGLFSIDRDYFFESGSYDEGMDVWGGENLEMSFRIWQCGGKLEIIPCSRVGHVFRSRFPYKFPGGYHEVTVNLARVVSVWMDSYSRHVFSKRPDLKGVAYGDISSRLDLRKKLNCKSFQWYLENIYPEQNIPEDKYLAHGEVRNPQTGFCLDTMGRTLGSELGISPCHGLGGNQHFALTQEGQLIAAEGSFLCVEDMHDKLLLLHCDGSENKWTVFKKSLRSLPQRNCLTLKRDRLTLDMQRCEHFTDQEWIFSSAS